MSWHFARTRYRIEGGLQQSCDEHGRMGDRLLWEKETMGDKDRDSEDWKRPDQDDDDDIEKRHDLGDRSPGGGREEDTLPDRDGPPRK